MTDVSTVSSASSAAAEKQAIGGLAARMSAAWAVNTGESFVTVFTPDATVVLPNGVYLEGADRIRDYMGEQYAGKYKNTTVTGKPLSIRLITADVAVMVTEGGAIRPGAEEVSDEELIQGTWVCVKSDGTWLVAAYQNSLVNLPI